MNEIPPLTIDEKIDLAEAAAVLMHFVMDKRCPEPVAKAINTMMDRLNAVEPTGRGDG